MRSFKHQMGVEGPSFYREQQERLKREQQQGRDQPLAEAPQQASMWEIFRPPPEERAAGPAVTKAEIPGPGFQRRGLSAVDATQWFPVREIWDSIGRTRGVGNQVLTVYVVTNPARDLEQAAVQIADAFRMPPSVFELTLDQAWKQAIGPFLEDLERSMMQMKPFQIPGSLSFEISPEPDNQLILVYQDR